MDKIDIFLILLRHFIIVEREALTEPADEEPGAAEEDQKLEKTVDTAVTDTVFIGHCASAADAEYVASLVREAYPSITVHVDDIGTSVGAHSGPGTIALFFVGNER